MNSEGHDSLNKSFFIPIRISLCGAIGLITNRAFFREEQLKIIDPTKIFKIYKRSKRNKSKFTFNT